MVSTDADTSTTRVLEAFSKLVPAIAAVKTVEEFLHLVAEAASDLIVAERCSIFLRVEGEGIFRGCVSRSKAGVHDEEIRRYLAGIPADGVTRDVLRSQRAVIVESARTDPRVIRETIRRWRVESMISVPMLIGAEIIGLMLIDDVDAKRTFSEEEATVAERFAVLAAAAVRQTQLRLELSSRLDAAGRQVQALRRATVVDDRLTDLMLEGCSLNGLLDGLAELLGKPCAVFRPSGEREAAALPEGVKEGALPRLLEPGIGDHPDVREALVEHEGSRSFVVGPLPRAGVLHRHVVAPVIVGEEMWGRLVVTAQNARLTSGDVVAVRRAAKLVALQVSTKRKARESDWNGGSSLAAELFGSRSDAAGVRRRAERLGVSLIAPRVVMVIASRSGKEDRGPDFRDVAAAFHRYASDHTVQATALDASVAVLVEIPEDQSLDSYVAEHKEMFEQIRVSLCPGDDLVAGVSGVHCDRDGYRTAYCEARQIVECIQRFSPLEGPALFTADELGVGSLLLSKSDTDGLVSFAERTVGQLLDQPSRADLVTTLWSFFEHMGSIRGSAVDLDIHENTVRYRLSRIEELTGLAVMRDPDAQLRARLSLLVLLLQGRVGDGFHVAASVSPPHLQVLNGAES